MFNRVNTFAASVLAVGLAATGFALASPAAAAGRAVVLPACFYEDGSSASTSTPPPCIWDGQTMGNGTGSSYIVRRTATTESFQYLPSQPCSATVTVGCDSGYRSWVQASGVPVLVSDATPVGQPVPRGTISHPSR